MPVRRGALPLPEKSVAKSLREPIVNLLENNESETQNPRASSGFVSKLEAIFKLIYEIS